MVKQASWGPGSAPAPRASFYLRDLSPGYAGDVAVDFARNLLDLDACIVTTRPEGAARSRLVSAWLAGQLPAMETLFPEEQATARALTAMTEAQRRSWLAHHFAAFRTCRLTAADFAGPAG